MTMSLLQNFYKKNIFIAIIIAIISSIMLSSISNFFIRNNQSSILQINKEKIYPKIIQLNYHISKKKDKKNIKNILSTAIQKQEYTQYIFKQTIIKLINETLLKQYVDKINLNMLDYQAIKMIKSSKYFKINKSFNYEKYLKFINFITYSNKEYINSLKKKIAVQYLIKTLLKSIIVLKSDIREKFKKIINRNNIQIINFEINLEKLIEKNNISKIKKSFYLNKDIISHHKFYTIKMMHLKKKKIINNNLKNKYLLYINKKKYNYRYVQTNEFKQAYAFIQKIKEKKFNKGINNFIIKKNNKKFNCINLGWAQKKNIPNFIKNFQLKKNGDCSKIISYKNNFFIFQLYKTKNFHATKKQINKNYVKKITKFNNIFFENIIKNNNINFLLKNKNIKLKKLLSKSCTKLHITKPLLYKNLIKYFHSRQLNKYIKKNFPDIKSHKKKSSIKMYKNIDNHIYLIQINLKKIKNIQEKKIIYQKILKNLISKKIKKNNYSLIKNFLLTINNKKKYFLRKNSIYINQPQTLSYEKNKEIVKIIEKLPVSKTNNPIYFILPNSGKNYTLIILQNKFFKKINTVEKETFIKQIKQYMKIKVINTILQNLYKKSKIIYNSNKI